MKKSVLIILMSFITVGAFATDGYFSHGYGTHYKGFAGAGIALYKSSLVAANNPAGLVYVGKRFDLGLSFFLPSRQYTVTGNPSGFPGTFPLAPGTVESKNNFFLVPTLGVNWMLNEKSSLGLSVFANGGLNTEYDIKTYDHPLLPVTAPTGIDLALIFGTVTYSRKLSDNHSIGVSAVVAYQKFEAKGLQAFMGFSGNPNALTNNGADNSFAYGLRIGYLGKFGDALSFGASYQTKIKASGFKDYVGLFAGEGNFDIPSNFALGFAYQLNPSVTIVADFKRIMYSDVNSVGNPLDLTALSPVLPDGVTPNPLFQPLGSDKGAGFGWKDMNVYKIGAEFKASETLAIRGGFSYGKQPIPQSEVFFNIVAPGVIESHASLGATKTMGKNELSFALTYALPGKLKGDNPLEAPGQQQIELEMSQLDFEIGFSF